MKRLVFLVMILISSCQSGSEPTHYAGYLELSAHGALEELNSGVSNKSVNVDNYLVYIYNHNGVLVSGYPKFYGEMAERVTLVAGDYKIKVLSTAETNFPFPTQELEEAWVYEGAQEFVINSDELTYVEVTASLLTAKIELNLTEEFKLGYPDYSFNISGIVLDANNTEAVYVEGGKKIYTVLSYTENSEKVYRTFASKEPIPKGAHVTMNFSYEGGTLNTGDSNFGIVVDSTLDPYEINWDINDGDLSNTDPISEKGGEYNPYVVEEAKLLQDSSYAWVEGYIVGYIKSSVNVVSNYREAGDSNIAIASSPDETNVFKMLFVELPGANSEARKALGINLTQGASLGYHVKLKGTLEKYYSREGLKGVNNADEYRIISK